MKDLKNFFSRKYRVTNIRASERSRFLNYLEVVKSFVYTTYHGVIVIDYEEMKFEYVSDNPFFFVDYTAEMVRKMGWDFYFNYLTPKDLKLLIRTDEIGFDFYDKIPIRERGNYTISFDLHIKNPQSSPILINHKLTPLFFTEQGELWKALCLLSLSNKNESGNIKIFHNSDQAVYSYDLKGSFWKEDKKTILTKREREIIYLSAKGYTIYQIAKRMSVSIETVKYHRSRLYNKLDVANMTSAIVHAINNKLI